MAVAFGVPVDGTTDAERAVPLVGTASVYVMFVAVVRAGTLPAPGAKRIVRFAPVPIWLGAETVAGTVRRVSGKGSLQVRGISFVALKACTTSVGSITR